MQDSEKLGRRILVLKYDRRSVAVPCSMNQHRSDLGQKGDFLWLADLGANRKEALYCDSFHYTARFSRDIAQGIAKYLKDYSFAK